MDDLTAAVSCSYPTLNKRFELALAPHEGKGLALQTGAIAALVRVGLSDFPGLDWLLEALEGDRAQVTIAEGAPYHPPGRIRNDDCPGPRHGLEPGGKVRHLADDLRGPLIPEADSVADHNQTGCNTDPRVQRRLSRNLDAADRLDDRESGGHRVGRVILVGARISEISQDAVPHEALEIAAMISNDLVATLVVGVDDLHHFLGVELERQADGIHQIAKESGERPTLGT